MSQRCIYCETVSECSGWTDLCDRRCYYGLSALLFSYESDLVPSPDPRIIEYFKKNPDPPHSFIFEKLKLFIASCT